MVSSYLNKFAANSFKRFPFLLNNILFCETLNAHCAHATIELLQKETPEFIPPQLWPPTSPDLNPVDYRVWVILQEEVYKTQYHLN